MNSGPDDNKRLISQLDRAISTGLRSQRIRQQNESMEYVDPDMQRLFLANMDFTENPTSTTLNALKSAVQACLESSAFDWAKINNLVAKLGESLPQESPRAKP